MSILIDELHEILQQTKVEPDTYETIVRAAETLEAEKKAERERKPKTRTQFVVAVKSHVPITDEDLVAHVFQMPEDDDAGELLSKIKNAALEYNLQAKPSKQAENFDDFDLIKRKFFKTQNIVPKTKDWSRVVVVPPDVVFGGRDGVTDVE